MQIDFMTAYLATSPGGLDTVAAIAAGSSGRYGAHHGNANPTAVQHSVNWPAVARFYINLCAQTTFVGLISVAPSGNSRSPMAVPAISGNAGTSKTGVKKVLSFQ
ncbi:Putative transport protein [Salmonella enterica subsp. enterica serovar Daytona]|uniref:Transport protein n=1 Tax=Salmonella enterica subsp. enterica serovar Daytona TaxID=1962639 RepID=A0A447JL21_SALET|nr:Putative transport protein [Salmonella enterica subsp. enterica serovar Daytona]